MERIIITLPRSESIKNLIISLLQELKVTFELSSNEINFQEDMKEILKQGEEDIKNGKTKEMTLKEIKDYLDV